MNSATKAIITKVHVQGYRSLEDVVVDLNPITVLVGPNGSGKSSFADVFVFLRHCLLYSPKVALNERGGIHQLITRTGDSPDQIGLRLEFESRCPKQFKGCYALTIKKTGSGFSIPQEYCETRIGQQKQTHSYLVHNSKWQESSVGIMPALAENHLALPLLSGTEQFAFVYQLLTEVLYYIPSLMPQQTVFEAHLVHNVFSERDRIAKALKKLKNEESAKYDRIEEAIKQIVPSIQTIKPKKVMDHWTIEFIEGLGEDKIVSFEIEDMSVGTLRLLEILSIVYLVSPPAVVILEEPVATMHPGMAAVLADALKESALRTQLLITTHSPDLITRFDVDSLRAVERIDGVTTVAPIAITQRQAIQQRLFTAGELHRIEGLRPALNTTSQEAAHA